MRIINYGIMEYSDALREQEKLRDLRIKDEISDTVMLLEHNHVYTIGKDLISKSELIKDKLNAPLVNVGRGGKITYHGPGQLVAYFIFKIPLREIGNYVNTIESTTLATLKHYGIAAYSRKNEKDAYGKNIRGAWCNVDGVHKKIAAQGIETKKMKQHNINKEIMVVTMHGFALNVNTNLDYFKQINPCGFTYDVMSSMQEILQNPIEMYGIKKIVQEKLKDAFKDTP